MNATRVFAAFGVVALVACAGSTISHLQKQARAAIRPEVSAAELAALELPIPTEKDLGRRAFEHVRRIVALGPRKPGSAARRRAADLICARLRALGLTPIRESWVDSREKIRFENVRCRMPGRTAKTLILGTHYDTKRELAPERRDGPGPFLGANDGGSGSGLLLAMAEDFAAAGRRRPTLELVWFDGEESLPTGWELSRALYGSREYARRHLVEGHPYGAFVLLDMVGAKQLCVDREANSTETLYAPFEKAVAALRYDKYFFQTQCDVDDDHSPFLEKGVPSIDLIQFDNNPHWHRHSDVLSNMSPRSLAIVGRTVFKALPGIESAFLR